MYIKYFFTTFLLLTLCASFAQESEMNKGQKSVELKNYDLFMMKERLVGMFSSEEQAAYDPMYFHINVVMKPIWTHRRDGYWMYVEQSYAEEPTKPYRQRIYHLFRKDSKTLGSQVYELKNAIRFAGEWRKEKPLEKLHPDSLVSKSGCVVYIHKNELGEFWGSTPGKGCITNYSGSNYVTSEIYLSEEAFVSWDRGFNLQDKQVWGAYKNGYIFKKVSEEVIIDDDPSLRARKSSANQPESGTR